MSRFPLSRALAGLTGRPRTEPARAAAPAPLRPAGPLVWVHVAGASSLATVSELGRIIAESLPVTLLVTGLGAHPPVAGEAALVFLPAPEAGRTGLRGFLADWRPDAAVWIGPPESPALLTAIATACPTTMVTPGDDGLAGADRATRAALRLPIQLWVGDASAAGAARAAGVGATRIHVTGPLVAPPEPPPCIESDRIELAERLSARPVWLAARPLPGELPHVLAAHRSALAIAHRAVLLLLPGEGCPEDEALLSDLAGQGFSAARRAAGEEPSDSTEIYIADRHAPEEDGLWFRLAPVCFLGGTFTPGGPVQPPAPAAALGSAITFGPHGGPEAAAMARLARAGAARALAGGEALPGATAELLAPDRAAELAAAAWADFSEGAATIVRLGQHLVAQLEDRAAL